MFNIFFCLNEKQTSIGVLLGRKFLYHKYVLLHATYVIICAVPVSKCL